MGEGPLTNIDRHAEGDWVRHLVAEQEAKNKTAETLAAEKPGSNIDPKAEARMESQNVIDALQAEVDTMTQERDQVLAKTRALTLMLEKAEDPQMKADLKEATGVLSELQKNLSTKGEELKRAEAQHRTAFGMQS